MTREEKLSRIVEVESFLTGLIISGRMNGKPYRPSTGDENQPLRDEIKLLREEVFGKPEVKPKPKVVKKKKSKNKKNRPTASVTNY